MGDNVLQQVIAFISPTLILNFIAKGKELSSKVLCESACKLPYLVDLGVVLLANDLLTKPFHNDAFTSMCISDNSSDFICVPSL